VGVPIKKAYKPLELVLEVVSIFKPIDEGSESKKPGKDF